MKWIRIKLDVVKSNSDLVSHVYTLGSKINLFDKPYHNPGMYTWKTSIFFLTVYEAEADIHSMISELLKKMHIT